MARSLYDVEQIDNQTTKFTVRPLPLYGPVARTFRVLVLGAVFLFFFLFFSANGHREGFHPDYLTRGVVLTALLALISRWIYKKMTGDLNAGRRLTQFTISPAGITFLQNGATGQTLARADIERMYITAPKAGETVVYTAFGTGGTYTGVGTSGGVSNSLAARSWQVVVQARGQAYWLGGGLTETMASSLSMRVQRALSSL